MSTALAEDGRGQRLLAFHPASTVTAAAGREAPCPLALVVALHRRTVLLGLHRWRRAWELPGGVIADGESPRAAAVRELAEETAVAVAPAQLRFAGLASFALVEPHRRELAALYVVRLETWVAPHPSDEFTDVRWVDPDAPPEPFSPLDLAVARLVDA